MKNKNTAVIGLLILTLSCSKTETIQPIQSAEMSAAKVNGTSDTIWAKPKGTYPNKREIDYEMYRVTLYEVYAGSKFTYYPINPNKAKPGDTIRRTEYGENFQIGYGTKDEVSWKVVSGISRVVFRSDDVSETFAVKRTDDMRGGVSVTTTRKTTTRVNDSVKTKTGTGVILDTSNGTGIRWDYEIIKPLTFIDKYKYPVSGSESYKQGSTTIIVDYGNGGKNNRATKSVNGGEPEPISVPFSGVPNVEE